MTRVKQCSQCGTERIVNTPCVDPEGNVWCESCVKQDKTGILFQGIDQHLDDEGNVKRQGYYMKCGCTVWPDRNYRAYTDKGSRAVHLTPEEKRMPVEEVLDKLIDMRKRGFYRCTGDDKYLCNKEVPEAEAKFPLFAGTNCPECWKKHQEHLAEQRRKGHVCRRCGKPYDACYC